MRLMKLKRGVVMGVVMGLGVGVLGGVGGGCNTIYFYETEKVSLTVEGKADASEPVAGNIGYKQRVVAVLPGEKSQQLTDSEQKLLDGSAAGKSELVKDLEKKEAGEAVSLISYFNLTKSPTGKLFDDPVEIRTAFVTGSAALALSDQQAADVARAMTDRDLDEFSDVVTLLDTVNLILNQSMYADDPEAKEIRAGLAKLGRYVPSMSFTKYGPGTAADGTFFLANLGTFTTGTDQGYDTVIQANSAVSGTVRALEAGKAKLSQKKAVGYRDSATATDVKPLPFSMDVELKERRADQQKLYEAIASAPEVKRAFGWASAKLK
jgi:hypothetical protein